MGKYQGMLKSGQGIIPKGNIKGQHQATSRDTIEGRDELKKLWKKKIKGIGIIT